MAMIAYSAGVGVAEAGPFREQGNFWLGGVWQQGWANYFCLGSVSKAYRSVDAHTRSRLRSWLRKKHKMPDRGTARFPDTYLENSLGLKKLKLLTRDFPWATA